MWYSNLYRRHLIDMHIEDDRELYLSEFSPEIYLENLKKCTLNVIVSDDEDIKISTEYYIDVNLKGIKLDTEDISSQRP